MIRCLGLKTSAGSARGFVHLIKKISTQGTLGLERYIA